MEKIFRSSGLCGGKLFPASGFQPKTPPRFVPANRRARFFRSKFRFSRWNAVRRFRGEKTGEVRQAVGMFPAASFSGKNRVNNKMLKTRSKVFKTYGILQSGQKFTADCFQKDEMTREGIKEKREKQKKTGGSKK